MKDYRIVVTRSVGADEAVLIMIDAPIGENSDELPLRIDLNDSPVYARVDYTHRQGIARTAPEHVLEVDVKDLAYRPIPGAVCSSSGNGVHAIEVDGGACLYCHAPIALVALT